MKFKVYYGKRWKTCFHAYWKNIRRNSTCRKEAQRLASVIVTIALLINPKQFGAKLIRFTNKIHWFIAIVSSKWQASLTFSMHQSNVFLRPCVCVWARFTMYSLKKYLRERRGQVSWQYNVWNRNHMLQPGKWCTIN